jgi:hypothetical protein
LNLGIKELAKETKTQKCKFPVLKTLNDVVYKLCSFFSSSSKREIILFKCELNDEEIMRELKLIRPFDVR